MPPPGGGSGIGRAVCVRLARDGARVAVADRDGGWAGEVREGLSPTPPPLHAAFAVDVASQDSVDAMVARVQVGGRCARLPPCPRSPHMPVGPICPLAPLAPCPHVPVHPICPLAPYAHWPHVPIGPMSP